MRGRGRTAPLARVFRDHWGAARPARAAGADHPRRADSSGVAGLVVELITSPGVAVDGPPGTVVDVAPGAILPIRVLAGVTPEHLGRVPGHAVNVREVDRTGIDAGIDGEWASVRVGKA